MHKIQPPVARTRARRAVALLASLSAVAAANVGLAGASAGASAAAPTWHTTFVDNFSGTKLSSNWRPYSGRPTTGSQSTWTPSRVSVGNGVLTLSAVRGKDGTWTTGGVGGWILKRTYGMFTARIRFDPGLGLWGAGLLWPVDGWPPELDYYEIPGGDAQRASMIVTTHFGATDMIEQKSVRANFQQWHTVSVIWLPTSIRYVVDGKVISTITNPASIPKQQMWPGFQVITGTGPGQTPTSATPSTVRLQVDWFRIEQLS